MNTIEDYLNKTESATKNLIEGINSYFEILREVQLPIFISESDKSYEQWGLDHREKIDESLRAQRDYHDEVFAMATMCGALLQIASMGIQKYSICEEGFCCKQQGVSPISLNYLSFFSVINQTIGN